MPGSSLQEGPSISKCPIQISVPRGSSNSSHSFHPGATVRHTHLKGPPGSKARESMSRTARTGAKVNVRRNRVPSGLSVKTDRSGEVSAQHSVCSAWVGSVTRRPSLRLPMKARETKREGEGGDSPRERERERERSASSLRSEGKNRERERMLAVLQSDSDRSQECYVNKELFLKVMT